MISQRELLSLFRYDSGKLIRTVSLGGGSKIGDVFGYMTKSGSNRYIRCVLRGKSYYLHKLIWLYHHSNPFNSIVDHINGDTLDNRIENLRLASAIDNSRNRKLHKNNTSGYVGVTYRKRDNKWVAQISIDSKMIHLGKYDTPEMASDVYIKRAKLQFGDFYRDNI